MKFHFFFGGPLSQWYPSNFSDGEVRYSCAEQYMMRAKAIMFGDEAVAARIMKTRDPAEHKRLGRCVKNFDVVKWNAAARDIVYAASMLKFAQSGECRKVLTATGSRMIVEASPTDFLWGIGLCEEEAKRVPFTQWKGANWLGEVLMAVRDGKPEKWADTTWVYTTPPAI